MKISLKRSCREFSSRSSFAVVLAVLWQFGCGNRNSELGTRNSEPGTKLVPLTNMVLIKAGTFWRIKYPVTLTEDFWLSKYEVTQGEYAAAIDRKSTRLNSSHLVIS